MILKTTADKVFHLVFGIYLFVLFTQFVLFFTQPFVGDVTKYGIWGVSDYLINYQGGFVRRGLMGEMIRFISSSTGFSVKYLVFIVAIIPIIILIGCFIALFKKQGYSWYLVPMSFFCGVIFFDWEYSWSRKDSLLLLLFILIICILRKISDNNKWISGLFLNVLLAFAILIQEAFIFFALPVIVYIIARTVYQKRQFIPGLFLSVCYLFPTMIAAFACIIYKGETQVVPQIIDSWRFDPIYELALVGKSIKALQMDTWYALNAHMQMLIKPSVLIFWSIMFPLIYYISTNALRYFNPENFDKAKQRNLSSILLIQFIACIPFWMGLSCDWSRIVLYWIGTSFAVFLILPQSLQDRLLPAWILHFSDRINAGLKRFIPQSKLFFYLLIVFAPILPVNLPIRSISDIRSIATTVIFAPKAIVHKLMEIEKYEGLTIDYIKSKLVNEK